MSSGEKSADVHDAASVKSSRSELDKAIDAKTEDVYTEGSLDPVYQAKATILNDALQEIGMGKYNWMIFVVTGFGWLACVLINLMRAAKTDIRLHSDNLWPVGTTRCHRWL